MYRYRLNNIICRTFHNRIPPKQEKYTLREKLIFFTLGNMATMGIISTGYYGYINFTTYSIYKRDIITQVLGTCYMTIGGFFSGVSMGMLWPVTYCVLGANIYNYSKQLEEKEKENV